MGAIAPRVAIVAASRARVARDVVCLGKPAITVSNVLMTAGAMSLAPVVPGAGTAVAALAGTALVVAAANAFNMYLERGSDQLMNRTRRRPLPDGRLAPTTALVFGALTTAAGTAVLALGAGWLPALIGLVALVLYAGVYTPMKRRSAAAVLVGAVPGALPPVMGWAAATGTIDATAAALFAMLFVWQLAHFLAIASWRVGDYTAAGIRTVPEVYGQRATRVLATISAAAIAPAGALLVLLGISGLPYLAISSLLGLAMLRAALSRQAWARRLFVASLWYLPAIVAALALDRVLPAWGW